MTLENEKTIPVLSMEELKAYNGQDGNKIYVAYKGNVYDVTGSLWWEEGLHQGEHVAGRDLTEELEAAPHSNDVFKNFIVVAHLKKD